MQQLILAICFICTLFSFTCFAHEEPAKTLKEKQDKVKQKVKIYNAKIKSGIAWSYQIKENSATEVKYKSMYQEYDKTGNLVITSEYRNDTLTERVEYSYNANSDMLTEIEFPAIGVLLEKNIYKYDKDGRVISGDGYDGSNAKSARFEQKFNKIKKTIELIKYNRADSLQYRIIYKYAEDYDKCDYYESVKTNAKGEQLNKVEKKFSFQKQLVEKQFSGSDDNKVYTYEYQYNSKNDILGIVKKQKNGSIEWKEDYSYEERGNLYEIRKTDGQNKLLSEIKYTYEFYK